MAADKSLQFSGVHKPTGETALLFLDEGDRGVVWAQFGDLSHQHSVGWHIYPRKDWKIDRVQKEGVWLDNSQDNTKVIDSE